MNKCFFALICLLGFSQLSFSQIVNMTLDQKVSLRSQKEQITYDTRDYRKNISRSKEFSLTLKSTTKQDVIVIFCITEGGEYRITPFTGTIYPNAPIVFTESGSAESEQVKIVYEYRPKYEVKYGNDKVEAAVFLYTNTGKYLGMKSTQKSFADAIVRVGKNEMADLVDSMKY